MNDTKWVWWTVCGVLAGISLVFGITFSVYRSHYGQLDYPCFADGSCKGSMVCVYRNEHGEHLCSVPR